MHGAMILDDSRRWPPKCALFAAAWLFIGLAGTFDGYFAWHFRADFRVWEMNPWARWLAGHCGMAALLFFKASGLIFGAAVAEGCRRLKHRLALPMTLVIAGAYFFLSLHYGAAYLSTLHGIPLWGDEIALVQR
jgi:hypothetical protein